MNTRIYDFTVPTNNNLHKFTVNGKCENVDINAITGMTLTLNDGTTDYTVVSNGTLNKGVFASGNIQLTKKTSTDVSAYATATVKSCTYGDGFYFNPDSEVSGMQMITSSGWADAERVTDVAMQSQDEINIHNDGGVVDLKSGPGGIT